ncbi:MAG: hypothetical protein VX916_07235 [Planctomycetota bacterium]|nr:hypothetical protein [Planctomycetota bacterium]
MTDKKEKQHCRVLLVVAREAPRPTQLANGELPRVPPCEALDMAGNLLDLGAEVRVIDQHGEKLPDRVVRREARLWRANIVLIWAGGSPHADNPHPDVSGLARLLGGWIEKSRIIICGPLATRYGSELVSRFSIVEGALSGGAGTELIERQAGEVIPGLCRLVDGLVQIDQGLPTLPNEAPMTPWHLVPLECYPTLSGWRRRIELVAGPDPSTALKRVAHAIRRGGAGFVSFLDRDLAKDETALDELCRGMRTVTCGIPWVCRVRSDHLTSQLAVSLMLAGCQEVRLAAPGGWDDVAHAPMDDPDRARLSRGVDVVRATGMSPVVEYVVGRPGHSLDILSAWRRWIADRHIAILPVVRVLHAGDRGEGEPILDEAHARAGCWDNELKPRDVERAVRVLRSGKASASELL